jgi:hypothetical protein
VHPAFTLFGTGALIFAALLLALPIVQVARGGRSIRAVSGLLVAGCGFLLVGFGFVFADHGFGGLVLPGIIVTAVGHFWQQRVAGTGSRGKANPGSRA